MDSYQKFIQDKAKKKREFMGAMFFPRTPVLLVDFSKFKTLSKCKDLLKGIEALNITTLAIPPKNNFQLGGGKNIHWIKPEAASSAICAADFSIVLNGDATELMKNGCVPISKLDGNATIDYDPLREKGNGFYFKDATKWEIFAAVVRALETYKFPYDWENLIRDILNSNN